MGQSEIHVRGHKSFNRPATFSLRAFAFLVDICIVLTLGTNSLSLLRISPFPGFGVFLFFLAVAVIYWLPQKAFLGMTCGERFWQLRPRKNFRYRLREILYQCDHLTFSNILVSSIISLIAISASISSFDNVVLKHPLWKNASLWRLEPFAPNSNDFVITPFFYTVGGWPKTFNEKPIFYTLMYEKGPPSRFVGHIVANWSIPDIKVTLEGPKTPEKYKRQNDIKECILREFSFHCLVSREASLARHMDQVSAISPTDWSLKWFIVDNPMIPAEDQVQGIYLNAAGDNWIQDRFIVINANGVHQAIILNRSKTPQGDQAFKVIQDTLRSMRSFNDLYSGRAWVNRELEKIRLDDLQAIQNSTTLTARLAEIQSLLISRISVDPGSYESYFHLAGTSLILAKNSIKTRDGLSVIALQNLQNAYHFAMDISPKDTRTAHIQDLWIESNKR